MMRRSVGLVLVVALGLLPLAGTAADDGEDEVREVGGTSIIGNEEVPKSLFIVPWKSSEVASETGVNSDLLNQELEPVDREVFNRQLDYYELSASDD